MSRSFGPSKLPSFEVVTRSPLKANAGMTGDRVHDFFHGNRQGGILWGLSDEGYHADTEYRFFNGREEKRICLLNGIDSLT